MCSMSMSGPRLSARASSNRRWRPFFTGVLHTTESTVRPRCYRCVTPTGHPRPSAAAVGPGLQPEPAPALERQRDLAVEQAPDGLADGVGPPPVGQPGVGIAPEQRLEVGPGGEQRELDLE